MACKHGLGVDMDMGMGTMGMDMGMGTMGMDMFMGMGMAKQYEY